MHLNVYLLSIFMHMHGVTSQLISSLGTKIKKLTLDKTRDVKLNSNFYIS